MDAFPEVGCVRRSFPPLHFIVLLCHFQEVYLEEVQLFLHYRTVHVVRRSAGNGVVEVKEYGICEWTESQEKMEAEGVIT